MSIAQTDASGNQPEWRDFLRALYSSAPDDLYFELRCIHPTTGDARSFWSKVGDCISSNQMGHKGVEKKRHFSPSVHQN